MIDDVMRAVNGGGQYAILQDHDGSRAFPMIADTAKLGVGDPFLMAPLPYGYFRGKRAEADYGGRSSTWQTGIE